MNFFNQNEIEYKLIIKYVVGLFIMNIGIAFSIKSNLGSTPVVSVPYAISLITGIDIGICNTLFQCFLVLIEFMLLRSAFHPKHFLQVFVGILFGAFTSISMIILSIIPQASVLWVQILFLILGILCLTQAVSITTNQSFTKIKVIMDISWIVLSWILSFVFLGHFDGSAGIGTIIAAMSIGTTVKLMNMIYARFSGQEADLKKM